MESYKIKKVLIDTVFIVSFLVDTENDHPRALELSKKLQGKELVITNALLIETMNLLIKKLNKNTESILKAYELIKNNFTIVYVDEELTERGIRTLVKYKFKLGLADSLSIEIMKDLCMKYLVLINILIIKKTL